MAESCWSLIHVSLALVDLAGKLAEFLCSRAQQNWWIGLGDEEDASDPEDTSEDSHDPFDPSPADGLANKSTNDRAEDGSLRVVAYDKQMSHSM